MKVEQIEKFLLALGVKSCADTGNGWVSCPCPLACFFHKSGKDSHPSFGIKIEDAGHSNFNCYACLSGSLETLIGTIEMQLKSFPQFVDRFDLKSARLYLDGEEVVCEPLPGFKEFTPDKQAEFYEWPSWWLEQYKTWREVPLAAGYLKMRNVPPEVADLQDLRFDPKREMIVAPYRNLFGKLAGARGRSVRPEAPLKHYDYTCNKTNNAELVWYGEECLMLDQPVIVVEGQFDRMRVQQVWPSVVAGLSAKVTPFKMKRLTSCKTILTMYDHDEAGERAHEKMVDYLSQFDVMIGKVEYPGHYKDPDSVPVLELKELLQDLHGV